MEPPTSLNTYPWIERLPDEIFLLIFGFVRGDVPRPQKRSDVDPRNSDAERLPLSYLHPSLRATPVLSDVTSIQNCRLVCRHFRNIASEFLLHTVQVTPTSASLAHLDQVSRHPAIARGVSTVRVVLEYHSIPVDHFADRIISWFRWELYAFLEAAAYAQRIGSQRHTHNSEIAQKARRLIHSWERRASFPVSEQERSDIALLHELFAEYRDQVADAEICLQQTLLPAVAQAMVRLRRAGLHITDRTVYPRRELSCFGIIYGAWGCGFTNTRDLEGIMKDPAAAVRMFLSHPHTWPEEPRYPHGWPEEGTWDLDIAPPSHLLYRLPLEVYKAGVDLRVLEVSLWGKWYWIQDFEQDLTPQELHGLQQFASGLKHFAFDGASYRSFLLNPKFAKYLKTLMSGQRLQSVSLDFGNYLCIEHQDSEEMVEGDDTDLGGLLPLKLSPRLSHFRLRNCSFDTGFLSTMLAQFKSRSVRLDFGDVRLLDGSWSQALDWIREKATGDSEVYYSRGPEFDDEHQGFDQFDLLDSDGPLGDAYRVIFGEKAALESLPGSATLYIRGRPGDGQLNPFRLFQWPQ